MKKPLPPLDTAPAETVTIPVERLRQLEKESTLLRAVKDAGYLDGHHGEVVFKIANLDYHYHLM